MNIPELDPRWHAHCAAVIPCLNEAAAIGPLVTAVRRSIRTVVVVDDGSTDSTSQEARTAGAVVLQHLASHGKGASLRTGWNWAIRNHYSWVLLMDGDGQHSPDDIPRFFERAAATGAKLIVGNRMDDALKMPWLRRQVNRWMSRRISARARRQLPDSQCGFRLAETAALSRLPLVTDNFEIESEMLLHFCTAGLPVEFVPIQVLYRHEHSKICPWTDTWRWFKWWLAPNPPPPSPNPLLSNVRQGRVSPERISGT